MSAGATDIDVIDLLGRLVRIPSVNPMGGPGDGPIHYEARLTEFLVEFFRELGVPHEVDEIRPGRANVVARYDAPGARRALLFDVHQDTVPIDGMTIPPFIPTVENGRLRGRGSCDVKGSMAAMLKAFERLVRERPPGSASVILACTVDEEYTHLGASRIADTLKPDLAIVAEPTRLGIVNAHKGVARWIIRARGVACHSSTPQLGDNAIYRMARVVNVLRERARALETGPIDPILGTATLSVGVIQGGTSVNVVPDACSIEIDRRMLPGETAESAREEVAEALRAEFGDEMAMIEIGDPWIEMPPLSPRLSEDWVGLTRDAVAEALGTPPPVFGVPYGTDAGPLSEAGIPCLVIGPGDIAQAHTKDEWIEIDQVRAAVDVYFHLARALG